MHRIGDTGQDFLMALNKYYVKFYTFYLLEITIQCSFGIGKA